MKKLNAIGISLLIMGIILIAISYVPIPIQTTVPKTVWKTVDNVVGETSIEPGRIVYINLHMESGQKLDGVVNIVSGGNKDIEFYILNSENKRVFSPGRVSGTYEFEWSAPAPDTYRINMDNSFSWFTSKYVKYTFNVLEKETTYVAETKYENFTYLIYPGVLILLLGIGIAIYTILSRKT